MQQCLSWRHRFWNLWISQKHNNLDINQGLLYGKNTFIAKLTFNLACTKSMYVINHGLAPFFKSMLNDSLQKPNIHVFGFDESLNEVTQTCEMDRYIRYWNDNSNTVNVRYYGSSFLGHATHQGLLHHFNSLIKNLNLTHLNQISMDGPSINMKFFDEFSQHCKEHSFHSLISIGSCGLHIVHGSLSWGETKSRWSLKNFLKGVYYILHNSPACREDYESVAGSNSYLLSFWSTRWSCVFFHEVLMTCI